MKKLLSVLIAMLFAVSVAGAALAENIGPAGDAPKTDAPAKVEKTTKKKAHKKTAKKTKNTKTAKKKSVSKKEAPAPPTEKQ